MPDVLESPVHERIDEMPRPRNKTSRNEDRHKQPRLAFHLPQDLYDAFNAHVKALEPKPSESEVLRLALQRYLAAAGDWPPAEEVEE